MVSRRGKLLFGLFIVALSLSFVSAGLFDIFKGTGKVVEEGCMDSDGGNIYSKGSVEDSYGNKEDYCVSDSSLMEYYCSDDKVTFREVTCPSGNVCENGACTTKVSPVDSSIWTQWYDRDTPDEEGFDGFDDETLFSLNKEGYDVCSGYRATDIEVKNVDSGAMWSYSEYLDYVRENFNDGKTHYHDYFRHTENKDNIRAINPEEGFLCRSDAGNSCRDYKVRFKCGNEKMPDTSYGGTTYWSDWYNTDDSSGWRDNEDDETLDRIRGKGYNVCRGETPLDIQTKNSESSVTWTYSDMPPPMRLSEDFFKGLDNTDNVVTFSPNEGFVCEDTFWDSCRDYEVRFLCSSTAGSSCEDSDGGRNIYEKGVSITINNAIHRGSTSQDSCIATSPNSMGKFNSKDKLLERYCNQAAVEKGDFNNFIAAEYINCNPREDYEYLYRCVEGACVAINDGWTEWFSRDNGKGDYDDESLDKLRKDGEDICGGESPIDIELAMNGGKKGRLLWSDFKNSGFSINEAFFRNPFSTKINKFSPTEGFVCEKNFGNECGNYKVRFLCSEGELVEEISCMDSDEGENIYEKGYADLGGHKSWDVCEDGTSLRETYCFDDGINDVVQDCPNGCENGACVEESKVEEDSFCEYYLVAGNPNANWHLPICDLNTVGLSSYRNLNYSGTDLTRHSHGPTYLSVFDNKFDFVGQCFGDTGTFVDGSGDVCQDLNFYMNKAVLPKNVEKNSHIASVIVDVAKFSETDCQIIWENLIDNQKSGMESLDYFDLKEDYSKFYFYEMRGVYKKSNSAKSVYCLDKYEDLSFDLATSITSKQPDGDCVGCELEGQCYALGFVKDGKYCSEDLFVFVDSKVEGNSCNENFECADNICLSGNCVSSNLWSRFSRWFK
ncbi:MAG: hypothetical protein PF542_04965 [Nanoarchaeota archaeon]|jgi:hypothetical protein|nr:hypothetical protein [Nanoarchaeota archaeon]